MSILGQPVLCPIRLRTKRFVLNWKTMNGAQKTLSSSFLVEIAGQPFCFWISNYRISRVEKSKLGESLWHNLLNGWRLERSKMEWSSPSSCSTTATRSIPAGTSVAPMSAGKQVIQMVRQNSQNIIQFFPDIVTLLGNGKSLTITCCHTTGSD